jgi:hypothetical protein
MKISSHDLSTLNNLAFDARVEPEFEVIKHCLTWADERPLIKLSDSGQEFLSDLWIIRGFIHRLIPSEQWGLDPKYFSEVWNFGLLHVAQWPGFRRLTLTEKDNLYLQHSINNLASF